MLGVTWTTVQRKGPMFGAFSFLLLLGHSEGNRGPTDDGEHKNTYGVETRRRPMESPRQKTRHVRRPCGHREKSRASLPKKERWINLRAFSVPCRRLWPILAKTGRREAFK